ncbi:GPW/gp25 family protein [Halodesulfovibrio aestuarii]|uniref:GPW/gp25 family protein n=1 Tax=Halodesulfovibrio aestuarii TaxID=126333 RepID=A0ABV4JTX9_9BACT
MIGVDAVTGKQLSGTAHLDQSVRDILATRKGTRLMRRDYGSDVPNLVDSPLSPENLVDIFAAVAEALDRWEPRLRLDRVQVSAVSPGKLTIDIFGTRLDENGEPYKLEGVVI